MFQKKALHPVTGWRKDTRLINSSFARIVQEKVMAMDTTGLQVILVLFALNITPATW
jgi:hypothetical protein